jgi:hypothetical protein
LANRVNCPKGFHAYVIVENFFGKLEEFKRIALRRQD